MTPMSNVFRHTLSNVGSSGVYKVFLKSENHVSLGLMPLEKRLSLPCVWISTLNFGGYLLNEIF